MDNQRTDTVPSFPPATPTPTSTPPSGGQSFTPIKSIRPKKPIGIFVSAFAGIAILITLFVTVNGALHQQNAASHASYAGIVSGNVYEFINKCSTQAMDVSDNSKQDGAHIVQWPWTNNGWNNDRRWMVTQLSDGSYTIRPMSTLMYLAVENNSASQGAHLIQRTNTASPTSDERWIFAPQGNDIYKVINQKSGLAIGIKSCTQKKGATIDQWKDDGSPRLQWIVKQPEGTPAPSPATSCIPRPSCKPGFCTLPNGNYCPPAVSPTCTPPPPCLTATPRCMLAQPVGGWCSAKPTIAPAKQTKNWIIVQQAAIALNQTPVGAHFIQSINTPKTYEIVPSVPSGTDPLPKAIHVESFKSYQALQIAFSQNQIPANIKAILYDNETWAETPANEQQHPFTYVPMAEQLVHQHGLLFINSPAADLSKILEPTAPDNYTGYLQAQLANLAQYADVFDIQAQNAPSSAEYYQFAQQAVFLARNANSKATVLLGITAKTNGPNVQALIEEVNRTFSAANGYWFNIIPDSSGSYTASVNTAVQVIQSLSSY